MCTAVAKWCGSNQIVASKFWTSRYLNRRKKKQHGRKTSKCSHPFSCVLLLSKHLNALTIYQRVNNRIDTVSPQNCPRFDGTAIPETTFVKKWEDSGYTYLILNIGYDFGQMIIPTINEPGCMVFGQALGGVDCTISLGVISPCSAPDFVSVGTYSFDPNYPASRGDLPDLPPRYYGFDGMYSPNCYGTTAYSQITPDISLGTQYCLRPGRSLSACQYLGEYGGAALYIQNDGIIKVTVKDKGTKWTQTGSGSKVLFKYGNDGDAGLISNNGVGTKSWSSKTSGTDGLLCIEVFTGVIIIYNAGGSKAENKVWDSDGFSITTTTTSTTSMTSSTSTTNSTTTSSMTSSTSTTDTTTSSSTETTTSSSTSTETTTSTDTTTSISAETTFSSLISSGIVTTRIASTMDVTSNLETTFSPTAKTSSPTFSTSMLSVSTVTYATTSPTTRSSNPVSTVSIEVKSVTATLTNDLKSATQLKSATILPSASKTISSQPIFVASSDFKMTSTVTSSLPPGPSVCPAKTAPFNLLEIAKSPIPSISPVSRYNGDVAAIVASLTQLLPASLNPLNAVQITSSLFSIVETIKPGDKATKFLGADFTEGYNAVVVLITSSQYKFNGLPGPSDIETYGQASCSVTIKTIAISGGGVGFGGLNVYGTQVLASITFSVVALKSLDERDVGFVIVNGVGFKQTIASTVAGTSLTKTVTSCSQSTSTTTLMKPSSITKVITPSSKEQATTSSIQSTININVMASGAMAWGLVSIFVFTVFNALFLL
ncbi:hypothetical protein BCR33DRAFT_839518 [Rhizoclosmatium globosum]|uniref:Bulb-type lectin domain-containing protein n=1 Tax=Rhizoclosmatium globosum TaxID=329046 RepID=A0A1Y2BD42_9FUNG|nr:hypothetical protein BCR33DRAFT_839518 [Rhizoclosmatium globosum]|eukprot:ORY32741.1 hypothetical protein BCR33DRAFT_839518 [Rhizoclosmatium globosum]